MMRSVSICVAAALAFISGFFIMRYTYHRDDHLIPALLKLPFDPSAYGLDESRTLYTKSLRKKLCILDVDTRTWNVEDKLEDQSPEAYGRLNHYLYAKIHGYDYKFIQATTEPGLHATWVKVEEMHRTLQEGYQFVIFTDSDIVFPHLELPMEYLMDRWNITSDIAMAAAEAPDEPEKYDIKGERNANTGFMIAQNTPIIDQMMKDWAECPSDKKYPECSQWKDAYWHEQTAYSNYIRHDYEKFTRTIPCDEADGAPEHNLPEPRKCSGRFVRHYWVCKECLKGAVLESFANLIAPEVALNLVSEWKTSIFGDHRGAGEDVVV